MLNGQVSALKSRTCHSREPLYLIAEESQTGKLKEPQEEPKRNLKAGPKKIPWGKKPIINDRNCQ